MLALLGLLALRALRALRALWGIDSMRTLILIMMASVIAGCVSTPIEAIVTDQALAGWKIGSQHDMGAGKGTIIELIPTTESIDHWKQLATIQFLEGARQTPQAMMQALESSMRARCSNAEWRSIAEEPHSVTYEWGIHACGGQDDQNEIARILQGNDGLHRIAYTEKSETMNPQNREFWMGVLNKAFVAKGGPSHPIVLKAP